MTPSTALQTPIERPSEDFRNAVHVCPRGPAPSPLGGSVAPSLRGSIEAPSLELAGLKVYAHRDLDHVMGIVQFPYEVRGRNSVRISYFNAPRSEISNLKSAPASIDAIASARLALVEEWRAACRMYPDVAKRMHAERVACGASIKCSPRSLQSWSRKLDTEGPAGLCDRYVPAPPAILALDPQTASDAVLVCAWWSFRIGSVERIDTPMMHSAAALLRPSGSAFRRFGVSSVPPSLPVADVLAAIDCYYSWPCDRQRFPFKPFVRWARYDFETWLFRACDENDYRRPALEGGFAPTNELDASQHHVPLRAPQTIRWPETPDPRSRRRDVYDRATRAAIASCSHPATLQPCNPSPLVTWLSGLDPRWRGFFLRVAKGDRQAKFELIATLPLWWDGLPEAVRGGIDARIEGWVRDSARTEVQIATRRVLSLIPHLRDVRGELTALSAAAGMVV